MSIKGYMYLQIELVISVGEEIFFLRISVTRTLLGLTLQNILFYFDDKQANFGDLHNSSSSYNRGDQLELATSTISVMASRMTALVHS